MTYRFKYENSKIEEPHEIAFLFEYLHHYHYHEFRGVHLTAYVQLYQCSTDNSGVRTCPMFSLSADAVLTGYIQTIQAVCHGEVVMHVNS